MNVAEFTTSARSRIEDMTLPQGARLAKAQVLSRQGLRCYLKQMPNPS